MIDHEESMQLCVFTFVDKCIRAGENVWRGHVFVCVKGESYCSVQGDSTSGRNRSTKSAREWGIYKVGGVR